MWWAAICHEHLLSTRFEERVNETRNLYALYDDYKYLGDYTAKEIARICQVKGSRVSAIADSGRMISDRYRLELVDTVVVWTPQLRGTWDRMRRRILTAGRR